MKSTQNKNEPTAPHDVRLTLKTKRKNRLKKITHSSDINLYYGLGDTGEEGRNKVTVSHLLISPILTVPSQRYKLSRLSRKIV